MYEFGPALRLLLRSAAALQLGCACMAARWFGTAVV